MGHLMNDDCWEKDASAVMILYLNKWILLQISLDLVFVHLVSQSKSTPTVISIRNFINVNADIFYSYIFHLVTLLLCVACRVLVNKPNCLCKHKERLFFRIKNFFEILYLYLQFGCYPRGFFKVAIFENSVEH